ncbi:MAG: DNA-binding transcriptional regulator [Pseudomonadota bacterium]
MKMPPSYKIALLFNASKAYDRQIISGVAAYLRTTRTTWNVFLEEDFYCRPERMAQWQGDGIIADFDDPAIREALADSPLKVVGVGGSYANPADYPTSVPYVATDNGGLIEMAYNRLVEVGLPRFALFSLPQGPGKRWATERENAYLSLMERDMLTPEIYRGHNTSSDRWDDAVEHLTVWLQSLPKPIGIIAVTDARARQLLQACLLAGISVPEEVALVGIDDDPLSRLLTRIPLTSVIQGSEQMGGTAAHMLSQMLHGARLGGTRVVVPPAGININATCQHLPAPHPRVMRARHFIRQYACLGIKAEQVADYVGVSRSSLEKHFREEVGCTVHDEILRFKLRAATAILASEPGNIAQVALSCGFTSVQYMHTVFKRELGCTPRHYQDRAFAEGPPAPVNSNAHYLI